MAGFGLSAAAKHAAHPFAGVGVVLRDARLAGALITVLITSVLCAPLMTFSSVLVTEAFHATAAHFSTAVGAFGVDGLVGAVALLGVSQHVERRLVSSIAALGYALAVVGAARWRRATAVSPIENRNR